MKEEFKAGFWGTRGSYLPRSMLRGFIAELGHGYEELLVGATDDSATATPEDETFARALRSSQVRSLEDGEGGDEDEDEDEEGEAEDNTL